MKSHANVISFTVPFEHGQRSKNVDIYRSRQQRRWLLGVSLLLILCWMVGAIWLISVRRGERSTAEVAVLQRVMAASFSVDAASNH